MTTIRRFDSHTLHGIALCAALLLPLATAQAATGTSSPQTQAGWQGVWAGQIGNQRVVVALYPERGSGRWVGRYFYERFGRDLSLWGPATSASPPDTAWQECPPDYNNPDEVCPQPSGTWSLSWPTGAPSKAPATLQGTWTAAGLPGRRAPATLPIELQRVANYEAAAEAFQDPYEQRRQRGIQGQVRPGGQLGAVRWHYLTDQRTKVSAPQFTSGAAADVLARINQQLKSQWRERANDALSAVDYDDELKVAFANPRWLALTYSVGLYQAGAAHPTSAFNATTYDLSTGAPVDWSRWFRFTPPRPETLDINRRDVLASQVLRAFTARAARAQSDAGDGDTACAQSVIEHYGCRGGRCTDATLSQGQVPDDWTLWPTSSGLAVTINIYSEVERHCRGEHIVLPWPQARQALLRPGALP